MMRKVSKSTLDFINKNININEQASSYPLRTQHNINTTSPEVKKSQITLKPLNSSPVNVATLKMTKNFNY
tara:strand:+ start:1215 stop:1424 length:210 start_codon:yes stop_codon:yes gene_type:complete